MDINPLLLNEQLLFCKNDQRIEACLKNTTDISTDKPVAGATCEPCFNQCQCIYQDDINLLECTSPSISELSDDYTSTVAWDFVNFAGSSIRELKQLRNLSLKTGANIQISGVDFFNDDIFQTTRYSDRIGLSILNSNLESLKYKSPFRNTNFSQLDISDSSLGQYITISTFINCNIDILSIRNAKANSSSPAFRRDFLVGDIFIKKLVIENGYGIYKANSPTGIFAIDPILMNVLMFQHLEELEIANTYLDFIISAVLVPLKELKVVRLENVNLKNVIGYYFREQFQFGSNDFGDGSVNWLANPTINEVYFGREKSFQFQDEYLCYFAGLNAFASEI